MHPRPCPPFALASTVLVGRVAAPGSSLLGPRRRGVGGRRRPRTNSGNARGGVQAKATCLHTPHICAHSPAPTIPYSLPPRPPSRRTHSSSHAQQPNQNQGREARRTCLPSISSPNTPPSSPMHGHASIPGCAPVWHTRSCTALVHSSARPSFTAAPARPTPTRRLLLLRRPHRSAAAAPRTASTPACCPRASPPPKGSTAGAR